LILSISFSLLEESDLSSVGFSKESSAISVEETISELTLLYTGDAADLWSNIFALGSIIDDSTISIDGLFNIAILDEWHRLSLFLWKVIGKLNFLHVFEVFNLFDKNPNVTIFAFWDLQALDAIESTSIKMSDWLLLDVFLKVISLVSLDKSLVILSTDWLIDWATKDGVGIGCLDVLLANKLALIIFQIWSLA
jgi:hypothetical protein